MSLYVGSSLLLDNSSGGGGGGGGSHTVGNLSHSAVSPSQEWSGLNISLDQIEFAITHCFSH